MRRLRYLIIGGGIIGSSIARELLRKRMGEVTVLEKEAVPGLHASGRNSGVLHSGINQQPGSLKARLCVEGNKQARGFCHSHNVTISECGTYVVANNPDEEDKLEFLKNMGEKADVDGLQILNYKEFQRRVPGFVGRKALFSPNGAIVDSLGFLKAVIGDAKTLGAHFRMNEEVTDIIDSEVITSKQSYHPDYIINCAGLYADVIAHMMGVARQYTIIPFRGDYVEIKSLKLNSMVYQVPDLKYPFLGVHLTKTIDGHVIAGPTAMLSFGRESYNKEINIRESLTMMMYINFWRLFMHRDFLQLVWRNAKFSFSKRAFLQEIHSLIPSIRPDDIISYRSGIRAQVVNSRGEMINDMLIEFHKHSTHILNAVSPSFTSSLAFAKYIVDRIQIGHG